MQVAFLVEERSLHHLGLKMSLNEYLPNRMKRPVKALLVFFNGKSNAGGAERMVQYLEEYLQSRGLQIEILDEHFLLNTAAGRIYSQLFRYRHFIKRKPIYMARFASAYLWIRKRADQVVISNGEPTPFYPVDFVICHGCYHTMELAYGRKETSFSRIAKLQLRALQRANQVMVVSNKVWTDLVNVYAVDSTKMSLVTNRVNTSYFEPIAKNEATYKTVLYVGRLEKGKGLDVVLSLANIIEQHKDWRLLIACNNPGNIALFKGLHHTNIKVGLTLENINEEAYSKGNLVIFPSLYESFGLVTIEALSAGIPVIGTPVGIIPELVERKFPGVYVLEPFSDESILSVFDAIVTDFKLVDRNKLHEQVKKEFGIESYRKRLDEVMGKRLKLNGNA